jgi:hypothetical protein
VSARMARALATAIVVLSVAAVIASIPIGLSARAKIDRATDIVIVGDPSAPRMQEALRELQRERRAGSDLDSTTAEYNPVFGLIIVLLLAWLAVGFLIVRRQPTNWAGWLFLITGAPFPLLTLAQGLVIYGVKADPGSVPLVGVWATLGEYALYPIALLPLLFLLYPDGHPPSPRWRWAVRGLVGGTVIAILGFGFRPGPFNNWIEDGILFENPLGVDALATIGPTVILIGTVIALISAFSTVIAVRQRFKRAVGEERQQMRWLVFVASLAGTFFALQWILGFLGFLFDEDAPIFAILFGLTAFTIVVGVPIAYLVAIFRHGLWNLDVVLKKTVQYGIVLAVFVVIAGVTFVAIPVLFVGLDADPSPRSRSAPSSRRRSSSPALARNASRTGSCTGGDRRRTRSCRRSPIGSGAPTRSTTSCPGWRSSSPRPPGRQRLACGSGSGTSSGPRWRGRPKPRPRPPVPSSAERCPISVRKRSRSATRASFWAR